MTTEFALFVGGDLRETRELPERPENIPHKSIRWYPVERRTGAPASAGIVGDAYVIVTPEPVPSSISMRQCRVVLARAGALDAIQAAVAALGGETAITWEYATTVERASPLVAQFAVTLGMSSEAVDDLFRAGRAV